MIVTYAPQATPIYAETTLVQSTDINDSVIFLEKQEGWFTSNVKYSPTLLDVEPKFEVDTLRTGYRVKTNTTNMIGTNIFDSNGIAYYYVIKSNATLTDALVSFTTVFSANGLYYTNDTSFNNYEVRKGIFLYTEPVIYLLDESENVKHEFTSKFIKITVKSNTPCVFKATSNLVFQPVLLNKNTIMFPSFYLGKKKYIDGNIRLVNKTEYLSVDGNVITPKDRIVVNNTPNTISNSLTNSLYLDYYELSTANKTIQYLAKISSHTFNFNNATLYLKLSPYMVELGTASNYDIAVSLDIDLTKITVIPSQYFTEYASKNAPQDIIFLNSDTPLNEIDAVSFKKYVLGDFNVFPSMIQYVKNSSEVIYQHTNAHVIPVGYSGAQVPNSTFAFDYTDLLASTNTVTIENEGVSFLTYT